MRIHRHRAWWLALASLAPLAFPSSDMDVAAGERLYTQCTGCHAPEYDRTGPRHCGVLGRKAGTVPHFPFTEAMKRSGLVWTPETLDRFLEAPLALLPGTSMGFAGLASDVERRQLIAYLATLDADNPRCQ